MELADRADNRWELYKVLGEPQRLRLLALAAEEELTIGELAELLEDSQPNVSRHLAPLRRLGLLSERKQGTRVFVRLSDARSLDPVVSDALTAGRALCEPEGVLERVAPLVRARDRAAREYFARAAPAEPAGYPDEMSAYLMVLSPLIAERGLVIDIGTGHGPLLDVLAPVFERVIAVDREPAQLERARTRARQRGYRNVDFFEADIHDHSAVMQIRELGPADVVFASRVLHHAPRPGEAVAALAELLKPGGRLVVLDYLPHGDEAMREQADLWLGFSGRELVVFAERAGLADPRIWEIPESFCGAGPDRGLGWQLLSARREGVTKTARHAGETENQR